MPVRMIRGLAALPLMLLLPTPAGAHEDGPPTQIEVATPAQRVFVKDALDVHTHLDPDSFGPYSAQAQRRLDIMEMARRAKAAGMRGFVIKQHYDQTAQLADIVTRTVPGVEAFGQLCLNLTVGGLNPIAIHHFAEVKGGRARIVSMPTWDSANNVVHSREPTRKSVAVSYNGALLPETRAAIEAIATAKVRDSDVKLALATGHISPAEVLLVIREARKQGVARIMVTHAMGHPVEMTLDQMKEAASLGAFIEFAAGFVLGTQEPGTLQKNFEAIRTLGADHVILSSDAGQLNQRYPDDALAIMAARLKELGISAADIRKMMVENPATLLGVPQRANP